MSDWKKVLARVAPTVATALGGPLAGMAAKELAGVLGVESDEKSLESAIAGADGGTMVKLRKLETSFQAQMAEIDAKDRDSARRNLGKGAGMGIQAALSFGVVTIFAYLLWALMSGNVDTEGSMRDIIIFAMGTLTGLLTQVYNYWLGNSSDSAEASHQMVQKMVK